MRKSSKQATREAILAAARTVLASDGPEALSLSKVAHLAGINRGTAYQHFETRDELIKATVAWVSEHLSATVFGEVESDDGAGGTAFNERDFYDVIAGLVNFAVENPSLGRIWLFEVLASDNPGDDPFFRQFKHVTQQLADSKYSQENIDVEALSVIVLAGYFLWPEWVRAHSETEGEQRDMAERMQREMLRLFMYGVLKPDEMSWLKEILRKN